MDIFQSVFRSFFVRTAAGQYDPADPAQLVRLLVTLARHKLASRPAGGTGTPSAAGWPARRSGRRRVTDPFAEPRRGRPGPTGRGRNRLTNGRDGSLTAGHGLT